VSTRGTRAGISRRVKRRHVRRVAEEAKLIRPGECNRPGSVRLPNSELLREDGRVLLHAVEREHAVYDGPRVREQRVVLQVLPNIRVVDYRWDAEGGERRVVADTREHEDLRRRQRASRKDDLTRRVDGTTRSYTGCQRKGVRNAIVKRTSGARCVFNATEGGNSMCGTSLQDACNLRADNDVQVRPIDDRAEVVGPGASTLAFGVDGHRQPTDADFVTGRHILNERELWHLTRHVENLSVGGDRERRDRNSQRTVGAVIGRDPL
jgi:hypothetical protein